MGFTHAQAQKDLNCEGRDWVKDQMRASNLMPATKQAANFHNINFLSIYTGMSTLCPACALLATPVTANNMHYIQASKAAVLALVQDSSRKLNNTKNGGSMRVANPANPLMHVLGARTPHKDLQGKVTLP